MSTTINPTMKTIAPASDEQMDIDIEMVIEMGMEMGTDIEEHKNCMGGGEEGKAEENFICVRRL